MTTSTRPKRARRFARERIATAPAGPPAEPANAQTAQQAPAVPARAENKTAQVLALLQRPYGATLEELVKATGWLPHTTRAALTGLRKKGHAIQRTVIENVSHYAITLAV